MIKRTIYHESIITGTGIEVPELEKMLDSQTSTLARSSSKTKLTTRVTLNLRNFKRRSSDIGLPQIDLMQSPRMTDARHSICGNELMTGNILGRGDSQAVSTTSGRSLEQVRNNADGLPNASCSCITSQQSINFNTTDMPKDVLSSFRAKANMYKVRLKAK